MRFRRLNLMRAIADASPAAESEEIAVAAAAGGAAREARLVGRQRGAKRRSCRAFAPVARRPSPSLAPTRGGRATPDVARRARRASRPGTRNASESVLGPVRALHAGDARCRFLTERTPTTDFDAGSPTNSPRRGAFTVLVVLVEIGETQGDAALLDLFQRDRRRGRLEARSPSCSPARASIGMARRSFPSRRRRAARSTIRRRGCSCASSRRGSTTTGWC